MRLVEENLRSYGEDGYLLLPDLFSADEVALLKQQLHEELRGAAERKVAEKGGQVVRSVYGSHDHNEVFRRLARHPRLVEPAVDLLGGPVYVYQFKINLKAAFGGDLWEWHQDYIFWLEEDGLPEPHLTSAVVFLDDVTEFNGPLIFVTGSHQEGVLRVPADSGVPSEYAGSPDWISNLTADLKYSIDPATLSRLVTERSMVAPKGGSGTALFFHPNLVHGSTQNMSPFDRAIAIVTYCRVDNVPRSDGPRRPEFLVSRDTSPIQPVPDDSLLHAV
ncbi:MAG TPA: phytanoyl-CoA dioxygenase family protein [Thermoanaerobaculia bacterium]|nr:phytanoyl-CoA dioxygenase family protein [Thermoanaerobaculia bacterium]